MNISDTIKKKFNKSDWNQYKFSDFVENIVEKVIPRESGLEHYIGLEHLDSGSLIINRFGDPQSLKGEKIKIYKGDVIFAKRNAYLKRASLAEFDAVASAHSMVLRAKPDVIMNDFFPFFMQSDTFWDVAIRISVGGLSPTINWKAMAKQEFLLPPKDQQAIIAELLWDMDDVVEKEKKVLEKLEVYKASYLKDLFMGKIRLSPNNTKFKETSLGLIPGEWKVKKVEDVAKVIRGSSPRPKGDPRYYGGDVPRLMGEDVTRDGKYVTPKIDFLTEEGAKLSRPMPKGTLVMICSGNVGLCSILAVDCCIHDGFLAFPELSEDCNLDFLYYTFNSQLHRLFQNATHGGVFTNLTTSIIKNFKIPIPPKNEQDFIAKEVSTQDEKICVLKKRIKTSKSLQKALINQVF